MAENYGFKTKHHKKIFKTRIIAAIVGCSDSLVRRVRAKANAQKPIESTTEQRIQVVDMLLDEGANKLIEEVKRVVTF